MSTVDYDFGTNTEDKIRCVAAVCASTHLLHLARQSEDHEWYKELRDDLRFAINEALEAENLGDVRATPFSLANFVSDTTFTMTGNMMVGPTGFVATLWTSAGTSSGPLTRLAAASIFEQGIRTMTRPESAGVLVNAMIAVLAVADQKPGTLATIEASWQLAFDAYTAALEYETNIMF